MTGSTLDRGEILDTLSTVASGRGWTSAQQSEVLNAFISFDGWEEWGDFDGQPEGDWYDAAASYLRSTGYPGADEFADMLAARVGMDEHADQRTVDNVVDTAAGIGTDTGGALQGVGDALIAAPQAAGSAMEWMTANPGKAAAVGFTVLGLVGLVAWKLR